ncbi:hypothetical protein CR513_39069, partial [Mucuna pruriens]
MEEEARPIRQHQRRLNPTILNVVKKEVTKSLAAGIKSGMTIMKNQHNELVPMQIQNNWQVCIDYRRLKQATHKDHFPLPFIDQMDSTDTCKSTLPFGLCNVLNTFQRCMIRIFSDFL